METNNSNNNQSSEQNGGENQEQKTFVPAGRGVAPKKKENEGGGGGNEGGGGNGGDNQQQQQQQQQQQPPEGLTDEQIKKWFEDNQIPYTDAGTLKKKLTDPPPAPTAEQLALQEQAFEKRMLGLFEKAGGKMEDFVQLKAIANSDLTQISEQDLVLELKTAGFNDDQIAAIKKERYYQLDDAELEGVEDENEREFLKKKKEFFGGKLPNRSSYKQKQAKDLLNGLKVAVETEDLQVQKEKEFSSKVEEHISKMPRKITFDLGKSNDEVIAPIQYEISDEVIAEVKDTLVDPAKRQQLFFNEDNTLNVEKVANVVARNKFLESALKAVYLEGGTRQVAKFNEIFPDSPFALGTGGSPQSNEKKTGKIVRRGDVRVAS